MSTLISSAVSGKKAAPKAPPRRRPAAAPAAAAQVTPSQDTQPTTQAESVEPTQAPTVAPASPPPTQEATSIPPLSPPRVVERSVPVHIPQPSEVQPQLQPLATPEPTQIESTRASDSQSTALPLTESHDEPTPASTVTPVTSATNEQSKRVEKRSREADSAATDTQPRKAPKRTKNRVNAVQASQESNAQASSSSNVVTASSEESATRAGATSEVGETRVQKRPRKPRAPKSNARVTTEDAVGGAEEEAGQEDTPAPAPKKARKPRAPKKVARPAALSNAEDDNNTGNAEEEGAEEAAESDPEDHQVDPQTLSMYDLSHDARHGKVSEREKKMAKIDWDEVARKRRQEADLIFAGEQQPVKKPSENAVQSTEDAGGETEDAAAPTPPPPETQASGNGVRFRLVNGEIVEDETSLTIDRRAQAEAAMLMDTEPVEEENDLTQRVNRTSWINARKRDAKDKVPLWKSKSDPWSEEETDKFYEALMSFGTDFMILSKMFEPKTRRQIKMKFNREERLDPQRIDMALRGQNKKKIDLDQYALASNRDVSFYNKYDSLEHAEAVIKAEFADKEDAMRAALEEDAENQRQKVAQAANREKQREAVEKKKQERARLRAAKRGRKWGGGTLGGGPEEPEGGEA